MAIGLDEPKTIEVQQWQSLTPKERLMVALSVIALVLILLGVGYGAGVNDTQGLSFDQAASPADPAVVLEVSVVFVPEDTSTKIWTGVQLGDVVKVTLLVSDIQNLLNHATTATLCTPDGLAISAIVSRENLTSREWGSAIHAVLVRPL